MPSESNEFFPVQAEHFRPLEDPRRQPRTCNRADAERAYEVYARKYGRSQSFDRIMQRGGFGWSEMNDYAPGWTPLDPKDHPYYPERNPLFGGAA